MSKQKRGMDRVGEDRLIIGVDFGTTFSGVAYCYSNNTPDHIQVVTKWPGVGSITTEKAPTELSYKNGFTWGYDIGPGDERISCIKLHVAQSESIPSFTSARNVVARLRAMGRTPADAARDYLFHFFEHAMSEIKRVDAGLYDTTQKQVIVTVPAIFSDRAKERIRAVAEAAGMGVDLRMISEPEAAACYALRAIQPNHLEVGNSIVVCDAGGGTVDIITYKIKKLSPLKLEESDIGRGELCGAAFLNSGLEALVKTRLGARAFDEVTRKRPRAWAESMKYFEDYVKRPFDDKTVRPFYLPLSCAKPEDDEDDIEADHMRLTSDEVRALFDPAVHHIIELIQHQVERVRSTRGPVSAVVMVGGFAQSNYLFDRVYAYFRALGLKVMRPANAWSAVVRGAVLRGLEGAVVLHRLSRYHYGTEANLVFDPRIHPEDCAYYDQCDGIRRVKDGMQWFITKGQIVAETESIKQNFVLTYAGPEFPNGLLLETMTLFASSEDVQPTMLNENSMQKVCTFSADPSVIPKRHFERVCGEDGQIHWKLTFVLEMRIDSARLEFAWKVGRMQVGTVEAIFEIT